MPSCARRLHLAALGREWIAAWNSRDLERVLALYAEDCEMDLEHMKIPAFPFTVTDWSKMAAATYPGETGQSDLAHARHRDLPRCGWS